MQFLVIFASVILCAQAIRVPYTIISSGSSSFESSEEEYRIYLPNRFQRTLNLPGVGVIQQPTVEAVKIKVPRYASPEVKQLLLTEALARRGLTLQDFAPRDVGTATLKPAPLVAGKSLVLSTATQAPPVVSGVTTRSGLTFDLVPRAVSSAT